MPQFPGLPAVFYSSLGADPEMCDLVAMFVDEMPERVASLCAAYDSADRTQLQRIAHQIKGAAGSYGFDQITPFAARLENAVRDEQAETEIRAALDDLAEMCRRAQAGADKA